MIGNDEFVRVFGSVPAGDDEALIQIVSAAVRAGFAIVLDHPGEKKPMCILNAKDRNAADRKAKDDAAKIGDPRWHMRNHDCGLNHALTVASLTGTEEAPAGDPSKVRAKVGALIRRLTKAAGGVQPNIGVELGKSNLLVIDVDTLTEVDGFAEEWKANTDAPLPGMTVLSPGKKLDDGEWVHKHGGHYWFAIPEDVKLPAGIGALKAEKGWVAMWDRHQVLVPPSKRPEGAYEMVGGLLTSGHDWIIAKILHEADARIERVKNRGPLPDGSGDIDEWAANLPWAEILTADGWTETGLPDRCSCPIFTAPGPHGSPKSATAHEVGCDHYDTSPGHAPMHIWTDSAPDFLQDAIRRTGSKTFTKLQYIAWRDHDGATTAALRDIGLNAVDSEYQGFSGKGTVQTFNPIDDALAAREEQAVFADVSDPETGRDPFSQPGAGGPGEDDTEPATEPTRAELIRSLMIGSEDLDGLPEPEPLISGLLDVDTIARITGKSNHGKSFVTLDMAACVAMGRNWHGHKVTQGLVVYMVAEGVRGWKKRMRAWEQRYNDGNPIPKDRFLILPVPIQATGDDWPPFRMALEALKPVFVILDTQARVTVGVDENSATEMGIFVDRMESIRRATGACVVTVHHLGHQGEHARGSTAMIGAIGSEIRVKKPKEGEITVESEKQKDSEAFEPIKFKLEKVLDSVIPVPDGWTPVDPDTDPMLMPAPPARPIGVDLKSSVRDRFAAVIWKVFSHGEGATRASAMSVFTAPGHPDYGSAGKTARYTAWNDLVRDGVLVQQTNDAGAPVQRWKLDPAEADRLGLTPPAGPVD